MTGLNIMSVVGTAVPQRFRDLGLLACWYVVRDGEIVSQPQVTRALADEVRAGLEKCFIA